MNIGIYIEMNILSCLLCIMLFYQQRRHKVFGFLGTSTFNALLWSAVCILLVDTLSWLLMGDVLPHTDIELMLVQSIYYLLQAIVPLLFFMYCLNVSGILIRKVWEYIMVIPVLYTAVVMLLNFRDGFAFYVLNNHVERGAGFLLAVLAPMVYIINSLILCLVFCFRNRSDSEEKYTLSLHMFICVVINFVGASSCVFVSYLNPWHIFVFSLIYLYIQLHGHHEHDLGALAFTDSLTGLKSHAVYAQIKDKMNERLSEEPSIHFAVVVADINYLKQVNDTYGHETGNALIISAAHLICDTFKHSPVCRIGGDEFVVILERSDYENRALLCEQLAEQMKTTTFYAEGGDHPVSISLGMADYLPEQHPNFDAVFHAADQAMYENKANSKTNATT